MSDAPAISRREMFSRFLAHAGNQLFGFGASAPPRRQPSDQRVDLSRVAVVQGRFCLAYQQSFCSACVERCPVPGAIVTENHLPRVVSDLCTGCGVCQQVCPAPRNAVLMAPRRPKRF